LCWSTLSEGTVNAEKYGLAGLVTPFTSSSVLHFITYLLPCPLQSANTYINTTTMSSSQKRPGTSHSSGVFSGSISPMSPAKLVPSLGDKTPSPISRDLGHATYISHHSHMSKPSRNTRNMNINAFGIAGKREAREADNTENRFELFLLGDGEKKVTEEADTRKSKL